MISNRALLIGVFGVFLAAAGTALHADYRPNVPPASPPVLVPVDTLTHSAEAGTALITALPASADGTDVSYDLVRAPALSWLVDRSFLWDTRPEDAGTHTVLIERSSDARTDTLTLSITLTR